MAEINMASQRQAGVRRAKKLSTKVDFTPMVDLGFLLITFFMVATVWSKPRVMQLYLPADGPSTDIGTTTALTVIPLSGDKVFYYHGALQAPLSPGAYGIAGYSYANGIGEVIRQKQKALGAGKKFTAGDMMLIIKPSPGASYKNVTDILDEVLINDVKHYAFVDLDEAEKQQLAALHLQ